MSSAFNLMESSMNRKSFLVTLCVVLALVVSSSAFGQSATRLDPVKVEDLALQQGAADAQVELRASGSIVWTQYRDADANLVIELPNTTVDPGFEGLAAPEGLVEAIEVDADTSGPRPLTRIVVKTRQAAEHTLSVDGSLLQLQLTEVGAVVADAAANDPAPELMPVEQPLPTVETAPEQAFEEAPVDTAFDAGSEAIEAQPAVEELGTEVLAADTVTPLENSDTTETWEEAPAPIAPVPPVPAIRLGTADNPAWGPAPTGIAASRLEGVLLEQGAVASDTVVRVLGDGQFRYTTFLLEDPARFVIDLQGAVNVSSQSSVAVSGGYLDRVRMSQFAPQPDPVSRVVFDLADSAWPVIETTDSGLAVRFVEDGHPALAAATPTATDWESTASQDSFAETAVASSDSLGEPVVVAETAEWAEETPLVVERGEMPAYPVDENTTGNVSLFEAQDVEIEQPQPLVQSAGSDPFGVRNIDATGQREYFGEPISMSLKDADITEVLRSIARLSGLNIVIQPGVDGPVTVELDRVPWDQALEQILKINNLGMQLEGNILRIAPVGQLRKEAREAQELQLAKALSVPLKTVLKRISYAKAANIARILTTAQRSRGGNRGNIALNQQRGILSQRGTISVDTRTNTLIIQELPDYLDTVIQVIENLDIPEKQVMIEARIIETTRNFSRTLGVGWNFSGVADNRYGNTTGLQFPNNITGANGAERAQGGVNLLTGGNNGFLNFGLGNILNTFELDVQLQAAETDGLVNVISAPKVATLNNEQASIQTGLQIPIQTVANNTVSVQFINATLRLDVTPQVTAEGTILMDINIQKREPQLGLIITGATNAPIATREARTRVIVRDGGTAVIGGIYEVSANQGTDKVPGLANIPLLGHLFKNRSKSNQNEELLIFITPRVIQL